VAAVAGDEAIPGRVMAVSEAGLREKPMAGTSKKERQA
jgi:hypothetical protein